MESSKDNECESSSKIVEEMVEEVISEHYMPSLAIRIFQSINLHMASVSLGLTLAIVGPTLLDISEILDISVARMSYVAFSGDFGAFVGSFLATPVFKFFNAQKVIIACMLCCGVFNILIPNGGTPMLVSAFAFLNGCFFGIQEIGVYVWLVAIWKDHVSPAIQLLHLMYGIGALIAPLIAEPFLSSEIDPTNALSLQNSTIIEPRLESRVYIPYGIVGGAFLSTAVCMITSYCFDSHDIRPRKSQDDTKQTPTSKTFEWGLVFLVGIYTLIDVTLEACFAKFISIYAVKEHHYSKSNGAFLTSLCYGGFTVARILAVPLSYKLTPMHLMIIGQCILLMAAFALCFFTHSAEYVLWVACSMLGAGLSPLYGSCTAWLSNHVTLSHEFMSIVLILTCSGALIPPVIVGNYIESNPSILMYVVLACSLAMSVNLALMQVAVKLFNRENLTVESESHPENARRFSL